MAGELLPTPEMVAVAWLKANVPYLEGLVATALPNDSATWKDKGFVVVNVIGGSTGRNGVRSPALSLMYYGVKTESGKAPWNRTGQMAEQVRDACDPTGKTYATTRAKYRLTNLGAAYRDAKVLRVNMINEPRRRPDDEGDYAVIVHDIEMDYVVVPLS